MRIITADETGLVKVVRLESGKCLSVSAGEQARARAVGALCYDHSHTSRISGGSSLSSEAKCLSFHVARSAGVVETWGISDFTQNDESADECALSLRGKTDCPAGPLTVAAIPAGASGTESARILTCNALGQVQVCSASFDDMDDAPPEASFSIRAPVSAAIAVGSGGATGGTTLAAGGKENDLKTWDVETAQCSWKAKNAPHDFLDLRQPVWISSLRPLALEEGLQQIVAGTAHRQVRLYDTRAQKRPTHSVDADEHGVTTMAVAANGREVFVADTAGLVRALDLRKLKWGRRFSGPAGSVRGLALHPTLPYLACVGLDRMARVFDVRSAEQKFQVYLKQRLNAVLFDEEAEVNVTSDKTGGQRSNDGDARGGGREGSGSDDNEAGWGSGEEYEMDEDSSDADDSDALEEEEVGGEARRKGRAGGAGNGRVAGRGKNSDTDANGRSNGGQGAGNVGSSSSSLEEDESEDDGGGAGRMGRGDEEDSSGSDVDEEDEDDCESQEDQEDDSSPPKRHVIAPSSSVKKRRR